MVNQAAKLCMKLEELAAENKSDDVEYVNSGSTFFTDDGQCLPIFVEIVCAADGTRNCTLIVFVKEDETIEKKDVDEMSGKIGQSVDPKNKLPLCDWVHDISKPGSYDLPALIAEFSGLTVGTATGQITLCDVCISSKDCADKVTIEMLVKGVKSALNLAFTGSETITGLDDPTTQIQVNAPDLSGSECFRVKFTGYVNA